MTPRRRPALDGLVVIELDGGESGAIAGMVLAEHGATVLKVEPPEGAPERGRSGAEAWDRGKSSVIIDPTSPAAAAELLGILGQTDIIVHGRGRLGSLLEGIEANDEAGARRRIRCSIDGFGTRGPLASLPARDLLVAAHLGIAADQRGWLSGPSYPVHHVPSVGAGLLAVQGILAALLVRSRTGRGQRVATSLLAASLSMSGRVEADYAFPDRGLSARPRGTAPLYSVYACADDRWIQFGCLHAGFVERAVEALGIVDEIAPLRAEPGFGDGVSPTSEAARDPFYAAVEIAVRKRPRDAWLAILNAADVPVAPVLESAAFLEDPQGRHNGFLTVDDPTVGRVESPGPAVRLSETPARLVAPPPSLGQRGSSVGQSAGAAGSIRTAAAELPTRAQGSEWPLGGIVVVEIANVIAGPMTGRYLADLGARVIKIESLDGDIFRQQAVPEFHALNAGKLSLSLDLKSGEGREIALSLLERADVLVNNLRPGAAERLGLGDDVLRERNARLVNCQISAFGTTGPYALRAGGDPLAGAYTGMQHAQGGADHPVYVRGAPIDYTSALVATIGILLGLVARQRIECGQIVDTSLLDAGVVLNIPGLVRWAGRPLRDDRAASQHRRDALVGLYETADNWLAIAIESDNEWNAFAAALGTPRLDADPRFRDSASRSAHDRELTEAVGARLRTASLERWLAGLSAVGVPAAPVREPGALSLADSEIADNDWATEIQHPELGPLRIAHGWLAFSRSRSGCRSAAPALGRDNAAILKEMRPRLGRRQSTTGVGPTSGTNRSRQDA